MMSAFKEALKLALYTVQDELLNDTISKNILSEAKDDWEKTEVIEATAHVLTCEIIGGAWAVMDEWGTGSLMDPANPHLADYQASGMWNPARSDTRIRSRPKGEYVNIFGEIQESKAPHPGYDLERKAEELKAAGKPVNFPIIVTPPSHALRMAIEWIKTGRLDEIVASVVMEFPFADFLEITIRG
jgi:hypothetical protein